MALYVDFIPGFRLSLCVSARFDAALHLGDGAPRGMYGSGEVAWLRRTRFTSCEADPVASFTIDPGAIIRGEDASPQAFPRFAKLEVDAAAMENTRGAESSEPASDDEDLITHVHNFDEGVVHSRGLERRDESACQSQATSLALEGFARRPRW
jgi:hypothetical protein